MGRQIITRGRIPGYRYSPGVVVDGTAYLAGHFGVDGEGALVSETVGEQGRRALENMGETLAAAGMSLQDLVSVRVWLVTYDDMPEFDKAYGDFFPQDPPARTAFTVGTLPLGARVELDGIAVRGSARVESRLA